MIRKVECFVPAGRDKLPGCHARNVTHVYCTRKDGLYCSPSKSSNSVYEAFKANEIQIKVSNKQLMSFEKCSQLRFSS